MVVHIYLMSRIILHSKLKVRLAISHLFSILSCRRGPNTVIIRTFMNCAFYRQINDLCMISKTSLVLLVNSHNYVVS